MRHKIKTILKLLFNLFFHIYFISHINSANSFEPSIVNSLFSDQKSYIQQNDIFSKIDMSNVNITGAVSTISAVAVRCADNDLEAKRLAQDYTKNYFYKDLDDSSIFSETPAANYVVWGDPITGGSIPQHVYKALNQKTSLLKGNTIIASGICALYDAFVALHNFSIACWGNAKTCTGWNTLNAFSKGHRIERIHCVKNGHVVFVKLNKIYPKTKSIYTVFGDPEMGGKLPKDKTLLHSLLKASKESVIKLVGNELGVAVLFSNGKVCTWGSSEINLIVNQKPELQNAHDLVANKIGFSVITLEQKVFTWGRIHEFMVPPEIQKDGNSNVIEIYGQNECFSAILSDKSVKTWGLGKFMYCSVSGALKATNYVAFQTVQDKLKNVTKIVMNDSAFAAVLDTGDVIVWGEKNFGGECSYSEELRWAIPESLVASCCAFAFIRRDGRLMAWGDDNYGGKLDRNNSLTDIKLIAATSKYMAAVSRNGELVQWGNTTRLYSLNSTDPLLKLYYNIATLIPLRNDIFAIGKKNCEYSDWSAWEKYEKSQNISVRKRSIALNGINTICDEPLNEFQRSQNNQTISNQQSYKQKFTIVHIMFFVLMGFIILIAIIVLCSNFSRRDSNDLICNAQSQIS